MLSLHTGIKHLILFSPQCGSCSSAQQEEATPSSPCHRSAPETAVLAPNSEMLVPHNLKHIPVNLKCSSTSPEIAICATHPPGCASPAWLYPWNRGWVPSPHMSTGLSELLFRSAGKREKLGHMQSSSANVRHKKLRFPLKLMLNAQIKQFYLSTL